MQQSQSVQNHLARASVARQQNHMAEAVAALEQALAIDSDCLEAHLALAQIRFPGESYIETLSHIHRDLQPSSYVEIGVASGKSMVLAGAGCRRVGIDPAPSLTVGISPDVQIYRMTSAAFFAQYDLKEILGGAPLSLGFIDGMHLYENALEDFINLERFCAPVSTLLIHDCLPLNAEVAARQRRTRFWLGDVWRVLPILRTYRPDLKVSVIACGPSGLAVVRGLDPASDVLVKNHDQALAYGAGLDFKVLESLEGLGVEIVPSDWSIASRLWRTEGSV